MEVLFVDKLSVYNFNTEVICSGYFQDKYAIIGLFK